MILIEYQKYGRLSAADICVYNLCKSGVESLGVVEQTLPSRIQNSFDLGKGGRRKKTPLLRSAIFEKF